MTRSYRLLCPVARALDRVGDRWTMLIVRDLHGGDMRFSELLQGLPGLASNLLVTRLDALQKHGLVARKGPLYTLTDLGRRTDGVLWELALLGMDMPPDPDIRRPGHLRLVAVTLQNAVRKVAPSDLCLTAELVLDGESFTIHARPGERPTVRYGAPEQPEATAWSSYEPLMAASAGDIPLETFREEHVRLEGEPAAAQALAGLMARVMLEAFRS